MLSLANSTEPYQRLQPFPRFLALCKTVPLHIAKGSEFASYWCSVRDFHQKKGQNQTRCCKRCVSRFQNDNFTLLSLANSTEPYQRLQPFLRFLALCKTVPLHIARSSGWFASNWCSVGDLHQKKGQNQTRCCKR